MSLITVVEIVIKMARTKLFQKMKNVLCKHIIRFGKNQWTFVIESKQEHNLKEKQKQAENFNADIIVIRNGLTVLLLETIGILL